MIFSMILFNEIVWNEIVLLFNVRYSVVDSVYNFMIKMKLNDR